MKERWPIQKKTKRCTELGSADGSPSDGPGEYSAKMLISPLWCSVDGELPMKSRKKKRIRTLQENLDGSVVIF